MCGNYVCSQFTGLYIKRFVIPRGDWYGSSQNTDYASYEKLRLQKKSYRRYIPRILDMRSRKAAKTNISRIYICSAHRKMPRILFLYITSGRYPASSDEILIPEHLSSNGGVKYNIGDVLTLDLGVRISEGYALNQSNPFSMNKEGEMTVVNEELQVRETRTYTVCGFYERLPRVLEKYLSSRLYRIYTC